MIAIPAPVHETDPRIPDDMLADLRWMADSPHAIVTMPKSVLRVLIKAYERQQAEADNA